MTSNFNTSNISELEELRKHLAEASVELEEEKDFYKKKLAFQQKEIEEHYEELSTIRMSEKGLRVKVN